MKKEIKELFNNIDNLKKNISKDKKWGFNLDKELFIKGIYIALTPQSYGFRLENFVKHNLGKNTESVSSKLGRGDLKYNDFFIEVKASIITSSNNALNLVQIRSHQLIDYYIVIAYDIRNNKFKEYIFLLTKDDMEKELVLMKSTAAHGIKNDLKENKTIEKRLSLIINEKNKDFNRWNKNYLTDFKSIVNILNK